jgi:hypothetical protein
MDNNEPQKITFEAEEFQRRMPSPAAPAPGIMQWVIRHSRGYIKDEKQAQYAMIGFIVLAIGVSVVLLASGGGSEAKFEAPPGKTILYPGDAPPRLEENLVP